MAPTVTGSVRWPAYSSDPSLEPRSPCPIPSSPQPDRRLRGDRPGRLARPGRAAPAAAAGGSRFVDMANGYRSDAGRGPVALHSLVDQIAVERGHQLADDGQLGHDFAYLERRFDDLGICWRGLWRDRGLQLDGRLLRIRDAVVQLDHPPQHHARRLHPRRRQPRAGRWPLVRRDGLREALPTRPDDQRLHRPRLVDLHRRHRVARRARHHRGLLANPVLPAEPGRARPDGQLPRSAPSTCPARRTTYFVRRRDAARTRSRSIALAEADIVSGCAASRYCPINSVTRGQMASFLDRALDLPPATEDYFSDDNGASYEAPSTALPRRASPAAAPRRASARTRPSPASRWPPSSTAPSADDRR